MYKFLLCNVYIIPGCVCVPTLSLMLQIIYYEKSIYKEIDLQMYIQSDTLVLCVTHS